MDLIDRSRTGIARYFPTFTDAYRYAKLWLALKRGYLGMLDKLVESSKKDRFSDRSIKLLVIYVHQEWWGRWAANMLVNAGDRAIDPLLRRLIREDEPAVQLKIAYILSTMREPAALALIDKLGDDDIREVDRAANALGIVAEKTEVDLSKVADLLHGFVSKRKNEKNYQMVRGWAMSKFLNIANAVVKRKKADMPGEMLPARIKPPKKGIYRMRRVPNG